MKARIWRLAGVGLLCISVTAQTMADEQQNRGHDGGQHGQGGSQGQGGNNQPRPQNAPPQNQPHVQNIPPQNQPHVQNIPPQSQPRVQNIPPQSPPRMQNIPPQSQPRPQNAPQQNQPPAQNIPSQNQPSPQNYGNRQYEHNGQNQRQNNGQWQNRPLPDFNSPVRSPPPPPQLPATDMPIQPRPDTVHQTQPPMRGYYQDQPHRNNYNQRWSGYIGAPTNDNHWEGRPSGYGNGWGPGPRYRPGQVIDRFPERNFRVPYRGMDYYYSGGYWYRPLGPRYEVVEPPRGIHVRYLPDYAQQVWIGGALLFLAAGSYYAYQESTQDYEVVEPPVGQSQPLAAGNGYDVEAYPANGQSPEQVSRDGYECYQYAVQQSGFDPRTATYEPDPSVVQAYRQAQGSCLSSRGYQVQ